MARLLASSIARALPRPSAAALARGARSGFAVAIPAVFMILGCASEASTPAADPLASRIESHARRLASDEFGGRAPGTPGGEAAARYIENRLRSAGLTPAGTDGFRQPVPFLGVQTLPSTRVWIAGDLRRPLDPGSFLAGWNRPLRRARVEAEQAIFVGYGIEAPEQGWNDFAEAKLKGRWAVALDGAPPGQPGFSHAAVQPVAKLHAAAKRGAAGIVLLSHARRWPEPHDLARGERILADWGAGARGQSIPWVALLGPGVDALSGGSNLWEEALAPAFRPRPLGATLTLELEQQVRRFESPNLVARLEGRDPALRSSHVCLSAHYDGLGRSEERVYPGVIDNAVSVAELLEVAALARREGPSRRSLLFLFSTGEEAGLLGSGYFVEHPTVPLGGIVACLNKDGAPEAWGRSRDVVAIAADASPPFAAALEQGVAQLGLAWSPNPFPSEGFFFRSDHYSFLRAGVPGALLFLGLAFEEQREGWGVEQAMTYLAQHYHRSTDDLSRVLRWEGTAQYARLWLALARVLADGEELPRVPLDLDPDD